MMKIDKIYRTCAYTNLKLNRNDLFRIVKIKNGEVMIQLGQPLFGRGAYLSKDKDIIMKAKKKKSLSRVLRCQVKDEIYDELIKLLDQKEE